MVAKTNRTDKTVEVYSLDEQITDDERFMTKRLVVSASEVGTGRLVCWYFNSAELPRIGETLVVRASWTANGFGKRPEINPTTKQKDKKCRKSSAA